MPLHTLDINIYPTHNSSNSIKVDGVEMAGVLKGFSIDVGVTEPNRVILDLVPPAMMIKASVEAVKVQEGLRTALEALLIDAVNDLLDNIDGLMPPISAERFAEIYRLADRKRGKT